MAVAAGALAAGLAVALTLASVGGARPPAKNFEAVVTAAAVLNNAALAALREPALKPGPGQFVYYKTYDAFWGKPPGSPPDAGTEVIENWGSVSGTRPGLNVDSTKFSTGGHSAIDRTVIPWCVHGHIHPPPGPDTFSIGANGKLVKPYCTPGSSAAVLPQLPATAAGMRAFLDRQLRRPNPALFDGRHIVDLAYSCFHILTQYYLSPAQQAAMYHALATIPGFRVVPTVTDVTGRAGVGVRYHGPGSGVAQPLTFTLIFDPTTYKPLGANIDGPGRRDRIAAITPPTIVSHVGQRP
jgi:hypothetical protein